MASEHISLDDVYQSEGAKGSVFRAVKMMSEEARFINDQARLGYIKLTRKPTTIAMTKFKDDKLNGEEAEQTQNIRYSENDSDWE